MARVAWRAAVHGVSKRQTWLGNWKPSMQTATLGRPSSAAPLVPELGWLETSSLASPTFSGRTQGNVWGSQKITFALNICSTDSFYNCRIFVLKNNVVGFCFFISSNWCYKQVKFTHHLSPLSCHFFLSTNRLKIFNPLFTQDRTSAFSLRRVWHPCLSWTTWYLERVTWDLCSISISPIFPCCGIAVADMVYTKMKRLFTIRWCLRFILLLLLNRFSPTLHDPMDCTLPGSYGSLQARVLEWVARGLLCLCVI